MKDTGTIDPGRICTVLVPTQVIAGTKTELRIEVEAPAEVLAADQPVEIRDKAGTTIGRATICPPESGDVVTQVGVEITTTAPDKPGVHRFTASLPPVSVAGMELAGIEVAFSLDVVAHSVAVTVFEVPQAIEQGAEFSATIGARCGAGCDLTGWSVSVRDVKGKESTASAIGDRTWPGTEGLRYAKVKLTAPETVGLAEWEVTVAPPAGHPPHDAGSRKFGLRTTAAADARLTVKAVDSETGAPIAGLKVVAGPFRTMTDAEGRAQLTVSRGPHRVFVSGKTYIPYREECMVEDEATLRVSLDPDLGSTDQMIWG